jgi:hypothetical protein
MSLSTYFSDNQTKQKAYDRYYDQKARSDFVQRRKLRALIAQEASDESLTDKLAQLYMSSVGKAPDYAYDKVLKKLQKAKPDVRTPEVSIPITATPATPATEPRRGRPRRSSVDAILQDQGTNQFIKQTRRELFDRSSKKTNMAGDAEEKAFNDAEEYVFEYQKKQRAKKSKNRRELNDAELVEARKRIAEKILQQNEAAADTRPAEKAKQAKRRLRMDDDDTEEKMSPEDLRRHQMENDHTKGEYAHLLRMRTREKKFDQQSLKAEFRELFQKRVDKIAGPGYFEKNYPTISPTAKSKSSFNNHKKSVKEFLDKVFS